MKQTAADTTIYVRDAAGNVLSVYTKTGSSAIVQSEIHLYGSARLGIATQHQQPDTTIILSGGFVSGVKTIFIRGEKMFEMSNHLGNVLVAVSDRRLGVDGNSDGTIDYFRADIFSATDYFPFGMSLPGRNFTSGLSGYRYGFNGKEDDKSIADGIQDYGMRIYSARLGKFLSVDPLSPKYPWYTPYQFAGNKPIWAVDVDGLEEALYHNTGTVSSATSIVENGFNGSLFGKYSSYNWFTTTQNTSAGGRANAGPTIKVEGLSTAKVDIITKAQTDAWTLQSMKEMGYNSKKEFWKAVNSMEEKAGKALADEMWGRMYGKVGRFMDLMKQDGYFLEKDGTYAFKDAIANAGKRTQIMGEGASQVLEKTSRAAREGEAVAASSRFAGASKFIKWGGRALLAVAIAKDIYDIYQADDKTREVVKKASFWSGFAAGAGGTGLAMSWCEGAPGPGTIVHGAATLVGGLIGGFSAEAITTKVYDYFFHK